MENLGYNPGVKERVERRKRQALRNKVEREEHLEMFGRLRKEIGTKGIYTAPWTARKR